MKSTFKIITLIVVALFAFNCNQVENLTTSASKLILVSLTGNDLEGAAGSSIIFSDILVGGVIINDNGVAELTAVLLNPEAFADNISYYQSVLVDQIDVRYTREDNQNPLEGVNVPYSFSQPVHQLIDISITIPIPFIIIRHAAKMEAPLVYLRELSQEKVLRLIAHVTVHGKDLGGRRVQPITGWITVVCADFADPGDGGGDK